MVEGVLELLGKGFCGITPCLKLNSLMGLRKPCLSKEFKHLFMQMGMTPITPSPYYPQSNGKLERCNKTIKEYLRTMYIVDFEDGCRLISAFVEYYNTQRLHSAIGSRPWINST